MYEEIENNIKSIQYFLIMVELSTTSTVLLEIGATFLGVIFALAADHWNHNRIDNNRVNEIIPYIYMEISENLKQIQRNEGHFITEYWLGHETDFVKWKEKEMLLRIIRIYNLMKLAQSPDSLTINERTHYANLLIEIISWFDSKAESDIEFEKKLEKIKQEYYKMTEVLREGDPSQYKNFKPKYFR
jgi:hypothetical protein